MHSTCKCLGMGVGDGAASAAPGGVVRQVVRPNIHLITLKVVQVADNIQKLKFYIIVLTTNNSSFIFQEVLAVVLSK